LQTFKSFLILALGLPVQESATGRVVTAGADRLVFGVGLVAAVGLVVWIARAGPKACAPSLAACVAMGLIFSPRAEDHTYSLAMTGLLLMIPALRGGGLAAAGAIAGGVLLSWPFHLQERMPLGGWHLMGDFARLWGAVILLGAALWMARRETARAAWAGAYAACAVGLVLVLWYAQPWRDAVRSGPMLAVTQTEQNRVKLIRLDVDEREIATIPVSCKGPFGVAMDPGREWLYAACTDNSQVSLIDLTARREKQIYAGSALPAWVQHREGSNEMWITNEKAGTATIYQSGTARLLAEMETGRGPSDIAFTDGGRLAWITNEASWNVSVLDAGERRKIIDIPVGKIPQGMALTSAGRLVVANFGSNSLSVLDTAGRREAAQFEVCKGPVDVAAARVGESDLAYASCFTDGAVAVVDVERREVVERIAVGEKPLGMAAHEGTRRVYVCVGGSQRIAILEPGRPSRVVRRIQLDGNPLQIAVAR
jgi:YVTN family beta-propeller protein